MDAWRMLEIESPDETQNLKIQVMGTLKRQGLTELFFESAEPTLLVLSVDLPPGVTEFEVPESFTALGDEFKFEILVREASGNQTAVESCFEID